MKSVLEIIRERTKGLRLLFAGNVLVSILSSVSYMVLTMAIQLIIAVASKETPYSLSGVALFAVGALAYWAVMSIFSEIIGGHLEINVEKKIRSGIMETLFRKTVLSVHTMNTGEITTRLTEDVRNISDFIVGISGRIIVAIFTSALAIIYMFILSWQMALIMVIMVPVLTVIISVFAPVLQKLAAENLGDEDSVKSLFQDVLAHLDLFKVYRMDSEMDAALDARYKKKRSSRIKLAKFRGVFMFLDNFMSFGVLIITLVIGAYFALKGQIGISKLITIVQLANYTSWPLSNFSQWVAQFATVRASTDRIDEIENLEDESERAKLGDNCVPERILLSDIAFAYDKEKFILKKVSATFEKGKIVGIVGKSGIGKSTLIQIIIGLYEASAGNIVFQTPDSEIEFPSVGAVGYVPSDRFIFSGTIKDNVCMSLPYDKERLESILLDINLSAHVNSLSDGIDAIVEEGGQNLSMGQAQRLAIARAFYSRANVLVFDEPTANLDVGSIKMFHDAIRKHSENKICIIVTHDKDTIDFCDVKYEIDDGMLREV